MEPNLSDLDALLLTVTNHAAKRYLSEAVMAYRVGALRLAIVGTWTAVAYDIIEKIRELATSQSDAQAAAFIRDFDTNVEANNVTKLLQIERALITRASREFGFPRPIDVQFLERLREDRHLCAHPAFSRDNELFSPTPDLVRAHIVQSIDVLLSQPALSGKAIIDSFLVDLASRAFPRDSAAAAEYVKQRYLPRMRGSAKRNLAKVLLKTVVTSSALGLSEQTQSAVGALRALQTDNPAAFHDEILPAAASLMVEGDETALLDGLTLLRAFPELRRVLPPAVALRLTQLASVTASKLIFFALGLVSTEVDDALLRRFAEFDASDMATAILIAQDPRFIEPALQAVRDAGSFRTAESRLANVLGLTGPMNATNAASLFGAAAENSQVNNASRSPEMLLRIAEALGPERLRTVDWKAFRARVWYRSEQYQPLWDWLRSQNVYDAPTGVPTEDEFE
jgi:hypothetical protein